jgi:sugar lactone lactonase YvrE
MLYLFIIINVIYGFTKASVPSSSLTLQPTARPTTKPNTKASTFIPIKSPTTLRQSNRPSSIKTLNPSVKKTRVPSSSKPTNKASLVQSVKPTSILTVKPTLISSFKPTQFPSSQLVLWNTWNDCVLTNPIVGFNIIEKYNSYEEAFNACEVSYPSCVGFSKDPTTLLFTLYSNFSPNYVKDAQTYIFRKANSFDFENPTTFPTAIFPNPTSIVTIFPTSKPTSLPTIKASNSPFFLPTFNVNYKVISTYAGNGADDYYGDNGLATNAALLRPNGLTTNTNGDLYVADTGNHVVRKINKITNFITTVAGNGYYGYGYNGENIQATSAMLNLPYDVFVDLNGNFYVADGGNFLIRKVDATTKILTNFVGNGIQGFSGDNGLATSASISDVYSLTLDPQQQNLFFTDTNNFRIRKVNLLTNIITTFAGTGSWTPFNGENILALNANIYYPMGVRFNKNGNFLYYIDFYNFRIRKINMKTNIVSTIAGNGVNGYNGENIAATSANIRDVYYLTIDAIGNVFFADEQNHIIRKIDLVTGFY